MKQISPALHEIAAILVAVFHDNDEPMYVN